MASSMLNGDRRWGQTRKSGMTVLGKVPKPINLPSQRLENHGLDPNVEIVPKGTLTWGSRPSLAGPNAWGSSSLSSPNTDGSTGSPSGLSGRPSSGGSYTRPSTATSDRSHQAVPGAWGSNSRPSSASGILPSDQAPVVATRPRSAETRHGSSQRSSFGESVPEGSAWGPSRIPEKSVTASKFNSFNLSSGDFPTLGSEKTSKSNVPQEGDSSQGRPASASGRVTAEKETIGFPPAGNEILSKGNVNAWRNDNSPRVGGGIPQGNDNWKRDQQPMQPYQNTGTLPPYQFDSWHGTPMASSPDGIWYRGPPPGGMFRPGGPGGYPVDPYVFYPQLPMRPLSNPQAGPGHGSVMASYGPMNGAPYHPHPPDSHVAMNRPLSPRRPDVYPGRSHHDSHYSPPPSFTNVNERDGPVLGVTPPQSTLYNQHPGQKSKVDLGDVREVPFHDAPQMAGKEVDDGRPHDSHRPRFKVLLKQHDRWKDNDSPEKKDQSVKTSGVLQSDIKHHSEAPEPALQEGDKDETAKMAPGVAHQADKDSRIHPSVPAIQNKIVPPIKTEAVDDRHANASGQGEDPKRWPVKKSSALIGKIESLNNKARVVDGRSTAPGTVKEDREKPFKNLNKADATEVTDTVPAVPEKSSTDPAAENLVSVGDTNLAPSPGVKARSGASEVHDSSPSLLGPVVGSATHSQAHRKSHSQQNRIDHHSRPRVNSKNGEEWRNKSPGSSMIDNIENSTEAGVQDPQPCQDETEKKELHDTKISEKPYTVSSVDSVDLKAQHARMKEIARQRAKQLQKEEEERIREQKARALAKLEELNRRTAAESSNQPPPHAPSNETQPHQDAAKRPDSKATSTPDDRAPVRLSGPTNAAAPPKAHKVRTLGLPKEGAVVAPEEPVDSSPQAASQSATPDNPPASEVPAAVEAQVGPPSQHNGPSKQKQTLQKRRHHSLEEKHVSDKDISDGVLVGSIVVSSKLLTEPAAPGGSTGVEAPVAEKDADESLTHHKKRNGRTMRNRGKPEEAPSSIVSQKGPAVEEGKPKPSEAAAKEASNDAAAQQEGSDGAAVGVQKSAGAPPAVPPNQVVSRGATEEAPPKSTLQWKPQHPRKVARNPQAVRSAADKVHGAEAVVWAPVKSTGKKEPPEEAQTAADKASSDPSAKSSSDVEHNLKFKRAEMERYVPKPIAQELLSQQTPAASHQQPAPSAPKAPVSSQGAANIGTGHSADLKVEPGRDAAGRESTKPSKNGKAHTSWRRRGPPEPPAPLPGSSALEGSSLSDSKSSAKEEQGDPQKEQGKPSDDGWKEDPHPVLVQSEPGAAAAGGEKDSARLSRGRRPAVRGHKVVGSGGGTRENWEPAHGRTDRAVGQLMTIESDETSGRRVVRHESDPPRSHWQLKSQHSSSSDAETRGGGGAQKVFSQVNGPDRESSLPGGSSHPQPPVENKSSPAAAAPAPAESRTARRHAERREKRAGEEPYPRASSAAAAPAAADPAPVDPEPQHEPVSSAPHRRGGQQQQQHKGWAATSTQHEAGTGQDGGGRHGRSVNADRRKPYVRSGYYSKQEESSSQHSSSSGSAPEGGAKVAGKYRERAAHHHSHPRHHGAHLQIPISGDPQ